MNKQDFPVAEGLPAAARLKMELMFEGVRYSEALGRAAEHSLPNYVPYRFAKDEPNPTGAPTAAIPYMMILDGGAHVRIRGNPESRWRVQGCREAGYMLSRDDGVRHPITMEPLPGWMRRTTSDGTPLAQAGVGIHGDMAIVNIAPGCEYFLADKIDGHSMRCTFCTYGAPDMRIRRLGQDMSQTSLADAACARLQEALTAVLAESRIRHIYLVGGSMVDWREEGARFIELAQRVQEVVDRRIPVTCGSGALPLDSLETLHRDDLVQNVCFNLEVWSEPLFAAVCPGKNRFVGYDNWLKSLENAVALWGRERVYSAMVAGIELEPEHGLTWSAAADLAIEGAEDLMRRGIIPIYSLYWPTGGRGHPDYLTNLKAYFERLNLECRNLRDRYGLSIWNGFMCHECAYMQLECDIDRDYPNRGLDT